VVLQEELQGLLWEGFSDELAGVSSLLGIWQMCISRSINYHDGSVHVMNSFSNLSICERD
jgi:hypothetical protein